MTTPDWPGFLAARLDDVEEGSWPAREGWELTGKQIKYMQADIAAKRAILDDLKTTEARLDAQVQINANLEIRRQTLWVIRTLCRPFADHPDHPSEEQ